MSGRVMTQKKKGKILESGSLFSGIPESLPGELFETLAGKGQVRIERILSDGHASPEGFWYDQDWEEWVVVLQGSAVLAFEGSMGTISLGVGDWITIPSHVRHRVESTDPHQVTIWLAVHYQ